MWIAQGNNGRILGIYRSQDAALDKWQDHFDLGVVDIYEIDSDI